MKNTSPVYIALWLLASLLLLGCGTGQSPLNLSMHVLIQSASPAFDAGQSVNLNAIVQNDFTGRGVTWRMAGGNCRGAACGSLSEMTATSAVYNPPASPMGDFSVKITATAVANDLMIASTTLSRAEPLVITTTILPTAAMGNAYHATLAATGGVQPYLWTLVSGSLPDGLVLDDASGAIVGTPTRPQISNFVVQLADFGGVKTAATLSITVQDVFVSILPAVQQVVEPSQTVAFTAAVRNDPADLGVKWSISGAACGSSSCGTFANVTPFSTTYTAATQVSADMPLFVIATSVADATRSASEQLIVAGPLSVPTASLVDGNVGVSYGDRVIASGGIPPYSFAISTGGLPPGLALDGATGAITGMPTTKGKYDFTVKTTDAGAPFAQAATKHLNITIADALPLVIMTESLPDAILNVPYALQLEAAGGLKPYRWSLLAGSLPDGLTLSSDGIIAGAPKVVGRFAITVQVMDAQTARLSAAKSFILNAGYPVGPHDGALNGHYALLFNGYEDGADAMAFAGSFEADGHGHITSGILDSNRAGGVTTGTVFTGRYLVGLDNRGEMTMQDANGKTKKFAFSVGTADGVIAQSARFIEFDDATGNGGTRGSGVIRRQDVAAFAQSALNGNYVFGLSGETPAVGPAAIVGVIGADGHGAFTSGVEDVNLVNSLSQKIAVDGAYGVPDAANGRATATLQPVGSLAGVPTSYSIYVINANEALMLSLDLRAQKSVLSGEFHKQTAVTYNTTALGSNFVIYENGVNADGSNRPVSGQTNALVAVYSDDGTGNCTLQAMDQNAGGVIQTYEQTGHTTPVNCAIQVDGRVSLGTNQTMYLWDQGTGFYIENGLAALGRVEPQTAGPFTNASVPATFFFGSLPPVSSGANVKVGAGTFEHQALFSPIADISTPRSLQPAQAVFLPYVVDTYGRTILPDKQGGDTQGGIYVMYVLSPTRMIWFDENVANPSPSLEVLETP
jgi:hypothetical protein